MNLQNYRNTLAEGHRLHDGYRIDGVLGQGGFGTTYQARDTNLDRTVAIKEYLPSDFAGRERSATIHPLNAEVAQMFEWGLKRFAQEARNLARFKHPNIVQVFAVFEENGTAYMVMEYEEGEGLDELFARGRSETEYDLLSIVHPLLDGLGHIHETGLIHRDIKPAKVYVRADRSPVLLDFGSARVASGTDASALTSLVSPGFAPYEQYHSDAGRQGAWTDLYALAATLYAGINGGRGPLDAIVRGTARMEGKPDPSQPATDLGRGRYSPALLKAIDAALGLLAEERPQTVAEWRNMLPARRQTEPRADTDPKWWAFWKRQPAPPTARVTEGTHSRTSRSAVGKQSQPDSPTHQPSGETKTLNNDGHGRQGGVVKWFDERKGYGFIVGDDGQEVFVHFSSIRGEGRQSLINGQRVTFAVGQSKQGPQATDVDGS